MPRLLILGAHPDDAEYHAGGLAARYRRRGDEVRMVSVTDGRSGHHRRRGAELVDLRREEARRAGAVIGATYETWDFPDGALQPTLELRSAIIRELRTFRPDLVLTHRPWDYHPDHRAVGQAVQDASYLVTVPAIVPDVAHLDRDPVVAYMVDLFTRPCPFRPDVLLDISDEFPEIVAMLACHASQVFEWLPYNQGIAEQVPSGEQERRAWLAEWFREAVRPRADRFRSELVERLGERGRDVELIEAYEISEYAARMTPEQQVALFPGCAG